MIRDSIKNEKYFEKYLAIQKDRITKFEDRLKANSVPDDRVLPVKRKIYQIKQDINIANYSSGRNLELFFKSYTELLSDMPSYWSSVGGYVELIRMLSIGIILDLKYVTLKKIIDVVEVDNPNDYLVDFLINHINDSWEIENDKFNFIKPYGDLKLVIDKDDKQASVVKLTEYLDKHWYKGHSSAGWYDSHNSKYNMYAGYWSFESGALVKILALDDGGLKDQQYYPYDMVHWKD